MLKDLDALPDKRKLLRQIRVIQFADCLLVQFWESLRRQMHAAG